METNNAWLTVRVPRRLRQEFHHKAEQFGKPADVLREIAEAFCEGRLIIKPPVNRKFEGLYK